MLGLEFNVWLGCWHITHMCSGRCQLVCLATVKTGEVSIGLPIVCHSASPSRGRGCRDIHYCTTQAIASSHTLSEQHRKITRFKQQKAVFKMQVKIFLVGQTTLHTQDRTLSPGMECSRPDFFVLHSLISTSKTITLLYIMTNKWQTKQLANQVLSI